MVDKFNHLRIEDNGNYVICYLSNPPTHTLTSSGVNEIHTFLDQIEKRDDLRVLAFTGDGENVFIKHYEVGELANTAERNLETKKDKQDPKELHAFHTMLLRLRDLDAIVVAGINGNTAGGGCEFSLGCDLRIATPNSKFATPEGKLGIIPGGGATVRLPRIIGKGWGMEMLLMGDIIDAERAFQIGLVTRLVESKKLILELTNMAVTLSKFAPFVPRTMKAMVHFGMDSSLSSALMMEKYAQASLVQTDDKEEGIKAFLEKRDPNFKGS